MDWKYVAFVSPFGVNFWYALDACNFFVVHVIFPSPFLFVPYTFLGWGVLFYFVEGKRYVDVTHFIYLSFGFSSTRSCLFYTSGQTKT